MSMQNVDPEETGSDLFNPIEDQSESNELGLTEEDLAEASEADEESEVVGEEEPADEIAVEASDSEAVSDETPAEEKPAKKTKASAKKPAEPKEPKFTPLQLSVLDFLKPQPRRICDICKEVGKSQVHVSHILKALAKKGAVRQNKTGEHPVWELAE